MARVVYVINEGGRIGADIIKYSYRTSIRYWLYIFGYSLEITFSKSTKSKIEEDK